MKIHVYSIMKNEEKFLPYFLRHYSTFADSIYIFNDNSTDNTVEIAKLNEKVQLLDYNYETGFFDGDVNTCFEKAYKKHSRCVADWVMVVDADEFLYNKNMYERLKEQKKLGRKVIKAFGFNMFSKGFPTTDGQIYEECFMGKRSRLYDKKVVFNPEVDVHFGSGRHSTKLPDNVGLFQAGILLLHFNRISKEFIIHRHGLKKHKYSRKKLAMYTRAALQEYDYYINNPAELIKVTDLV